MSYNYKSILNNTKERQQTIHPYCCWKNAFTEDEIDKICMLMAESTLDIAYVADRDVDTNLEEPELKPIIDTIRRSKVAFHAPKDSTQWIFDRLNYVVEMVNNRWYNFDLNGYDHFQYTEYDGKNKEGYGWHLDMFWGKLPQDSYSETRKLSLTLLLSNPGVDFEGGELQFGGEPAYEIADAKKGDIILFPSFELHRVSPVTQGLRKSIVVWVVGPKWK
jgi:PKHD-type hydroxylase